MHFSLGKKRLPSYPNVLKVKFVPTNYNRNFSRMENTCEEHDISTLCLSKECVLISTHEIWQHLKLPFWKGLCQNISNLLIRRYILQDN